MLRIAGDAVRANGLRLSSSCPAGAVVEGCRLTSLNVEPTTPTRNLEKFMSVQGWGEERPPAPVAAHSRRRTCCPGQQEQGDAWWRRHS